MIIFYFSLNSIKLVLDLTSSKLTSSMRSSFTWGVQFSWSLVKLSRTWLDRAMTQLDSTWLICNPNTPTPVSNQMWEWMRKLNVICIYAVGSSVANNLTWTFRDHDLLKSYWISAGNGMHQLKILVVFSKPNWNYPLLHLQNFQQKVKVDRYGHWIF